MRGAVSVSGRAHLFGRIRDGWHGHRSQDLPLDRRKQRSRVRRGGEGNRLVDGKRFREGPARRLEVAEIHWRCGDGHDLGPRRAAAAAAVWRLCDGTLAHTVNVFASLNQTSLYRVPCRNVQKVHIDGGRRVMRPSVDRPAISTTVGRPGKVAKRHIRNVDRRRILACIRAPHPLRIDVDHIGHVEELEILKDCITDVALPRQHRINLEKSILRSQMGMA